GVPQMPPRTHGIGRVLQPTARSASAMVSAAQPPIAEQLLREPYAEFTEEAHDGSSSGSWFDTCRGCCTDVSSGGSGGHRSRASRDSAWAPSCELFCPCAGYWFHSPGQV